MHLTARSRRAHAPIPSPTGALLGAVLALLGALPQAAAGAPPPPRAARRLPPSLHVEGIPPIPERVRERTQRYHEVRGAVLLDFEPTGRGGVLIGTRFGNTVQVHAVEKPGGYRRQVTFFTEPVSGAVYDPRTNGRTFLFRMDAGGGEFYQYHRYDLSTGRATLLTDGQSRNEGLRMANAGGRFAIASTRRNGRDFDLYVGDAAAAGKPGEGVKLVLKTKGRWTPLDWSSDDRRLLVLHYVSINEAYLHVLDVASGELRALTPAAKRIGYRAAAFGRAAGREVVYYASDEDSEFTRLVLHDLGSGAKEVLTPGLRWDVQQLAVARDGRHLAYVANEGGVSALYVARLDRRGRPQGAPLQVALPKGVISSLLFDRAGQRLGFTLSTARSTADVYTVELRSRKLTRWTFSEVGGLNPERFVAPELIGFKSFDGRVIPAFYYRPQGTPPGKRLPVVINIHGGPEAQSVASFNPLVQNWVNELGVAVLLPNVRGSAGYGKSYLLLDNGMKREDAVKDIGALLDWVAGRPELDASRVALIGGSYGGYMVLASAIKYAERIRCAVEIVGISNFVTFLRNTQGYRRDLRRAEYGDERDPAMRRFLESISPTTHAHRIKKPLFVAQGANDPRVPASESEQIVRTVRRTSGVPVWYLLAKDEGHGFRKKENRDYFLNAVILFFERYLLGR